MEVQEGVQVGEIINGMCEIRCLCYDAEWGNGLVEVLEWAAALYNKGIVVPPPAPKRAPKKRTSR
jgi:hypothetical protein